MQIQLCIIIISCICVTWGKGQCQGLVKKEMGAYKDQYSTARQQFYSFSVLWGKPISRHCAGDVLREKTGE